MFGTENIKEPSLPGEKPTKKAPAPAATGNDKLTILRHRLHRNIRDPKCSNGADLVISNDSDTTIATVLFEAIFYDIEGNVVNKVEHAEIELKPGSNRTISIIQSMCTHDEIRSYKIRVIRTKMADVEKVQIRKHEARTNTAGEEEIRGIVKNVSNDTTDAIFMATFYDSVKDAIGSKAILLKDIKPDSARHFHFKFKPQQGDIVNMYSLKIACDIEECK